MDVNFAWIIVAFLIGMLFGGTICSSDDKTDSKDAKP